MAREKRECTPAASRWEPAIKNVIALVAIMQRMSKDVANYRNKN
jgi:hypothetical protein